MITEIIQIKCDKCGMIVRQIQPLRRPDGRSGAKQYEDRLRQSGWVFRRNRDGEVIHTACCKCAAGG